MCELENKTIRGYQFMEEIGQGAFSIVYKVFSQKYNEYFVAKVIPITKEQARSSTNLFEAETISLMQISHPNVIKLYDFFREDQCLILIIEFCPGGPICNRISTKNLFSKAKLYSIAVQLLEALCACHHLGIAHRDIKTANILIGKYEQIKLSDFGLSSIQDQNELNERFCGSYAYKSPELVQNIPFDPFKADIWALGVVFYEIATGNIPWEYRTLLELKKCICNVPIVPPDIVDPEFAEVIIMMTSHDPKKRPSAKQLASLPIFSSENGIGVKKIVSRGSFIRSTLSMGNKSFSLKRTSKSLSTFHTKETFKEKNDLDNTGNLEK